MRTYFLDAAFGEGRVEHLHRELDGQLNWVDQLPFVAQKAAKASEAVRLSVPITFAYPSSGKNPSGRRSSSPLNTKTTRRRGPSILYR